MPRCFWHGEPKRIAIPGDQCRNSDPWSVAAQQSRQTATGPMERKLFKGKEHGSTGRVMLEQVGDWQDSSRQDRCQQAGRAWSWSASQCPQG